MTGETKALLFWGSIVLLVWATMGYFAWRDKHPRTRPPKPGWRCPECNHWYPTKVTHCDQTILPVIGYDERRNGPEGVIYGLDYKCTGRKPS